MFRLISCSPVLTLLLLGALASPGEAQIRMTRIIELEDGSIELEGPPEAMAMTLAQPIEQEADGGEEPSPRLERFKKLKFDRRPSVILDAWATPPEPAGNGDAEDGKGVDGALPASEDAPGGVAPAGEATQPLTEEEARAAAEAAEEAARAEEEAAEAAALDAEMEAFTRNVTLGRWEELRAYFIGLTDEEAKAAYDHLLQSLIKGPPKAPSQFARWSEVNAYAPGDIVGLVRLYPLALEKAQVAKLGTLLKQCTEQGGLVEEVVVELQSVRAEDGAAADGSDTDVSTGDVSTGDLSALADGEDETRIGPAVLGVSSLDAARLLFDGGFAIEAGVFLPAPEAAVESGDREALNLVARFHVADYQKEKTVASLETAWRVTQAALASGEIEQDEKKEALERAVRIAPDVREELGASWLEESFTERPERGMEILAVIGAAASEGLVQLAKSEDRRLDYLSLQTTAAEALLAAAPELAAEWAPTLELLAGNWLREAEYSYENDESSSLGPRMQRDVYGNFFYSSYSSRSYSNRSKPTPIVTAKLVKIRPSDGWLAHVSDGLRPRYAMTLAQLYLKVKEEAEAFPHIERLAVDYPERAKELVDEFLRVWTDNHDANSGQSRANSYIYFYGFDERADSIPLTRSKQDRNLVELAGWVERLRRLPVELDESLLASAFTRIHSSAEVYRLETIESVFGGMDSLEPETLAELAQRMRANLLTVWRDPNVQKDAKTRRRQKDIEREVLRGYEVTRGVIDEALERHGDSWELTLARAAVMHDENNYQQELQRFSEFSSQRGDALDAFARAAELYRETLPELDVEEETSRPYEMWFYACLGASDLGAIKSEMLTAQRHLGRLKADLESIEGEAGERHVAMFASTLFSRMSNANPAVKFRYVRAGLEIVGDDERAAEAREVYDYYRDLITEIQLETVVDGSDQVGHDEAFGVHVRLRHTREIEREAGGFSKYLTNQNNQSFGYNYGRPTENYRDKFEESARELLSEQFEVLSITFNHPDANSIAEERYGWRVTPYAYLLLKARGPEVDQVPSLRLDLDFLDTSGYAVLPVESPGLPIDAGGEQLLRPFADVALTQTLDERQAGEGKLVLEIQASAGGLVPELEELVDLSPESFDVVSTEDQGLSVTKFDEESEEVRVVSDRTWLVTLTARDDLQELPETFEFAEPRVETAEAVYQRYVDADLAQVERVVSLEARYGETGGPPGWLLALGGLGLLGAGFVGLRQLRAGGPAEEISELVMPEPVTPFTVIGLLRRIEAHPRLGGGDRARLLEDIERLEGHYFRGDASEAPDLAGIARSWLSRV